MSKSASAGLEAHIAQEVTTLATLWRVTRRDTTQFFFTDHDRDLVIDVDDPVGSPNPQTYEAGTGFTRTTITSSNSLAADDMSVESVLDSEGVQEQDLRAGLWDFAEVEVLMVNWDDLSQGAIVLRRGFLGEVSIRDDTYFAELRGLTQLLQQVVGDVYTPTCRVDLLSGKCTNAVNGDDNVTLDRLIESTEVASVTDDRQFTVPANFIERTDFVKRSDFFFSIGAKVDESDDPSIGRVTILRRATVEDGTFRNPYLVANATDLTNVRNDPLAWYALANDVDMTAFGLFTPIPNFEGGFDGRGFEIQNLNLDHSAAPLATSVALFQNVLNKGIIRRVAMVDANVDNGGSAQYKATLVGDLVGSTVEDCLADSVTAGGVDTDGDRAGGLIGTASSSSIIRRCFAAVPITGTIGTLVGGLLATDNGGNTIADNVFDSTVATTAQLGSGVVAAEVTALITADAQDRANYREPTGDTPERAAVLPNRGGLWDFLTVWDAPVASTSYPALKRWY